MRSVSWRVSGRWRTVPPALDGTGARFGGVHIAPAARPETGKSAPGLARVYLDKGFYLHQQRPARVCSQITSAAVQRYGW
jgi:hypothetical protein